MFISSCVTIVLLLKKGILIPKDFNINFYYNGKLTQLNTMSKQDASNAILSLATSSANYCYDKLSVKTQEGKTIISDADLKAACNSFSGGQSESDKVFFRGIAALGITRYINFLLTEKSSKNAGDITKFSSYINDTADYTWNNIRNPLSNALGSCYYRNSGEESTSKAEHCGQQIFFSVKGTVVGAIILLSQYYVNNPNPLVLGTGTSSSPAGPPAPSPPVGPPGPGPSGPSSIDVKKSPYLIGIILCLLGIIILVSLILYFS